MMKWKWKWCNLKNLILRKNQILLNLVCLSDASNLMENLNKSKSILKSCWHKFNQTKNKVWFITLSPFWMIFCICQGQITFEMKLSTNYSIHISIHKMTQQQNSSSVVRCSISSFEFLHILVFKVLYILLKICIYCQSFLLCNKNRDR